MPGIKQVPSAAVAHLYSFHMQMDGNMAVARQEYGFHLTRVASAIVI